MFLACCVVVKWDLAGVLCEVLYSAVGNPPLEEICLYFSSLRRKIGPLGNWDPLRDVNIGEVESSVCSHTQVIHKA